MSCIGSVAAMQLFCMLQSNEIYYRTQTIIFLKSAPNKPLRKKQQLTILSLPALKCQTNLLFYTPACTLPNISKSGGTILLKGVVLF